MKTIENLLDETFANFSDQGLTPVEIGIWVERDGGPYQVSITGLAPRKGEYGITYVTLGEDDVSDDEVYTMQDLYDHLEKNRSLISQRDKLVTICDDGDLDPDDEGDERNGEKPVVSFRFEDGQDETKKAKVILVC